MISAVEGRFNIIYSHIGVEDEEMLPEFDWFKTTFEQIEALGLAAKLDEVYIVGMSFWTKAKLQVAIPLASNLDMAEAFTFVGDEKELINEHLGGLSIRRPEEDSSVVSFLLPTWAPSTAEISHLRPLPWHGGQRAEDS